MVAWQESADGCSNCSFCFVSAIPVGSPTCWHEVSIRLSCRNMRPLLVNRSSPRSSHWIYWCKKSVLRLHPDVQPFIFVRHWGIATELQLPSQLWQENCHWHHRRRGWSSKRTVKGTVKLSEPKLYAFEFANQFCLYFTSFSSFIYLVDLYSIRSVCFWWWFQTHCHFDLQECHFGQTTSCLTGTGFEPFVSLRVQVRGEGMLPSVLASWYQKPTSLHFTIDAIGTLSVCHAYWDLNPQLSSLES